MIAFHYPNNIFKDPDYNIVLSRVDENNNFKDEYLFIYKNNTQGHFDEIKYDLINYLKKQQFVNNLAPIYDKNHNKIGIIIKLEDQTTPPIPPFPPIPIGYFPPIPLIIKDSIKDFNTKPNIGLENIGATCYMNATLQCLCNTKKVVDYFKYHDNLINIVKNDQRKEKLCSAFKLLVENLYPYPLSNNYKIYLENNRPLNVIFDKFYAPKNFKETISRMNPLFEGIAANDAKDLVNFLIMTLHGELNRAPPEEINMGNLLQDQTNKQLMFQNFASNFTKTHQSIISDIFYAMNCNVTQCLNCGVMSYNYQIYFFLIFPLEEVRKFVLMNNGGFNNNFNTNMVNIYDCFNFDRKINSMSGDNAMYCNYCKQTCASQMCTNLTTGPEVLIIILNRGKGIEFNVKINFCLDLDLSNYIEFRNTGCQYELVGVITHIGESSMSGHFIAYCKSYWDNKWYKFNDAIVSPVNDFKTEVIDFAMPYVLFYQKKKYN